MLVLLLAACGLTEDNFPQRRAEVYCPRYLECAPQDTLDALGVATVDDCVALQTSGQATTEDCAFDARAAQDCLDVIEEVSCEDLVAQQNMPACLLVCG